MQKRKIIIGNYDTALYGWTLSGNVLSEPEQKTKYVEKVCGDGSWDLSTALTDGIPRYNSRTLTVTLECSEGTRADRQELISDLVNQHDGMVRNIILPDYPSHYLTGRIRVVPDYNDLAHAAVTITATCEPWLYQRRETVVTMTAERTKQTVKIRNSGRMAVVPQITVTGNLASVLLEYNGSSTALSAGSYEWPTLVLTPGIHTLTYSGSGVVTITYREAVLR